MGSFSLEACLGRLGPNPYRLYLDKRVQNPLGINLDPKLNAGFPPSSFLFLLVNARCSACMFMYAGL